MNLPVVTKESETAADYSLILKLVTSYYSLTTVQKIEVPCTTGQDKPQPHAVECSMAITHTTGVYYVSVCIIHNNTYSIFSI